MKSIAQSNPIVILGSAIRNLKQAIAFIAKGKIDWAQVRSQMVFIGYESLPMILILTCLGSMIIALNAASELANRGGREVIGSLVAISNTREILPIFIAFAIGARCGTAITAETATMKVTEQIDALKLMKTDPIYYLLTPRLIAIFFLCPFLVAAASAISLYSGMLVTLINIDLDFSEFLESAWKALTLKEYFYPLFKTWLFTIYAILVNVTIGLGCLGGAKEVGQATNKATALVMIGIIILDGILTPILY